MAEIRVPLEYTAVGQVGAPWPRIAGGGGLADLDPNTLRGTAFQEGPRRARTGPPPALAIPPDATISVVTLNYWVRANGPAGLGKSVRPFVSWLNAPNTRIFGTTIVLPSTVNTIVPRTYATAPDGTAWTTAKLLTTLGGTSFGLETVYAVGGKMEWSDAELVITYTLPVQPPSGGGPVGVVTGPVGELASTSVTLTGTVNAGGAPASAPGVVEFEFGTTIAYGTRVSAGNVSGSADTPVSFALSGLSAGQLYHYRLRMLLAGVDYFGADLTFTTPIGGNRFFRWSRFNCQPPDGSVGARDRTRMVSFGFDIATEVDVCPPITEPGDTPQ